MKISIAAALGVSLLSFSARAQPALSQPQLGMMLDRSGAARPVYGVAASVTAGAAAATDVLAIACSRRLCLMKTDSALVPWGSAVPTFPAAPAPPGAALIALAGMAPDGTAPDGASAFVYFAQTAQLERWHDGQLDQIPWEVPGEMIAIGAGPSGTLDAAFRSGGRVWISRVTLADGNKIVTGSLPDDTGPVLLTRTGVVFATRDKIVLRHPDGSELSFPVAGARSAYLLGDGCVQIRAGDLDYALRIDPGREQLFLLPEPVQ